MGEQQNKLRVNMGIEIQKIREERRGGEEKVCVFHKSHKVKQTLKIYAVPFFEQYIIHA